MKPIIRVEEVRYGRILQWEAELSEESRVRGVGLNSELAIRDLLVKLENLGLPHVHADYIIAYDERR